MFVPQTHLPGREAEVDFGEIGVQLRGQLVTCHLFSLRMSYSGKAVHRASATGGQEAVFEGHVHAFQVLGGVPAGKIRYDNLKAAVAQVIGFSRQRVETDRWVAFRSHFDLDAFYCQPGIAGAHEKGGVEGDIGRFRRNHLVPIPEVTSLRELNDLIDDYDRADDDRRIGHRAHTVAESFSAERQLLKPLPVEPFETGLWLTPRVDRYAQITVRTNRYSVPSRLIGRQVRVLLNASDLTVYDGRTLVATHERLLSKGGACLDLDHLPRGVRPQARRFPRGHSVGAGPHGWHLHDRSRCVVGSGLQGPRRRGRHPRTHRSPSAAPPYPAPPCHCRHHRRASCGRVNR